MRSASPAISRPPRPVSCFRHSLRPLPPRRPLPACRRSERPCSFSYRPLFILYAEDRNLLPVREARYEEYGMREKVRAERTATNGLRNGSPAMAFDDGRLC